MILEVLLLTPIAETATILVLVVHVVIVHEKERSVSGREQISSERSFYFLLLSFTNQEISAADWL